jgi:hypothetical protein
MRWPWATVEPQATLDPQNFRWKKYSWKAIKLSINSQFRFQLGQKNGFLPCFEGI